MPSGPGRRRLSAVSMLTMSLASSGCAAHRPADVEPPALTAPDFCRRPPPRLPAAGQDPREALGEAAGEAEELGRRLDQCRQHYAGGA